MEILLVSQCDHKALKETRRILDQFACRTGERCWQTPITMNGLQTLHKMLRATARKNTAVACHRIGGRGGAELLWIVGDYRRFDEEGRVPTEMTGRNLLRPEDENNWDSGEAVRLLARMAGLLHDLGKSSQAFQEKLKNPKAPLNLWRHEWQSAQMLAYFVRNSGKQDTDWLCRLANGEVTNLKDWGAESDWKAGKEEKPLADLPPLAKAIIWLMVSHHRLPVSPNSNYFGKPATDIKIDMLRKPLDFVQADWNNQKQFLPEDKKEREKYEAFNKKYTDFGALKAVLSEKVFSKSLKNSAKRLLQLEEKNSAWRGWHSDLYIFHLARLSLMLADHHVSSWAPAHRPDLLVKKGQPAANTDKNGAPKQSLVGHLTEIAKVSGGIARFLESFTRPLTGLPPHKRNKFRKRVPASLENFTWQNKAWEEAQAICEKTAKQGGFVVNMASTGCGKTLGNAKIMAGLTPEKEALRMTYALGLRVLTRQTGDAYKEHLDLDERELGVFVGGAVSQEIAEFFTEQAAESGSESSVELFSEELVEIEFDADPSREEDWEKHPLLSAVYGAGQKDRGGRQRRNQKDRSFIDAPVLVCTVDHLVPATEAWRGGGQINPMLRLMSSDLILDELDDYSLEDMPALTRLVWYCGMLGRKVLLSSATLPESLVKGMFLAYRAGRKIYLKNHGGYSGSCSYEDPEIPCLWVDEFGSQTQSCGTAEGDFETAHSAFAKKRGGRLLKEPSLRKGKIIGKEELEGLKEEEIYPALAKLYQEKSLALHKAHGEIISSGKFKGKKVSFGLIRMANISPLYRVAQVFFALNCPEEETQIHLCVYHSRFPLICRSAIEEGLDKVFNRKAGRNPWDCEVVQKALEAKDSEKSKNYVFIVLASPVCEVGRDWDADWAIAEPSSLRSIIQLAGRVQRHRKKTPKSPNILLLNKNVKALKGKTLKGQKIAYERPGYEGEGWALNRHDLETLLRVSEYKAITSIPRLLLPTQREPKEKSESKLKLGDLELRRTKAVMMEKSKWHNPCGDNMGRRDAALCWWEAFSETSLTGLLPQNQPFREQTFKEVDLAFIWNEKKQRLELEQALEKNKPGSIYTEVEWNLERIRVPLGKNISAWNKADLRILLLKWLEAHPKESEESYKAEAERVTAFSARAAADGKKWQWHDVLGLDKS